MKKVIFVVLACLCAVLILTGCNATQAAEWHQEDSERFVIAFSEGTNTVYVDTGTGVMYFFHNSGSGGGMTVMVDADGKPLIWEGD